MERLLYSRFYLSERISRVLSSNVPFSDLTFLSLQWCSQDPRCNRLQLTDLMVAPLQHCTKFPLLLGNVRKYTGDGQEREALADLIDKVNASLRECPTY